MLNDLTVPNVINAGIQRTGSTWLYSCIKENPQVYVPYVKEIHYFDNNYQRGAKWYADFFQKSTNEKIRIDITPNYFHDPLIPAKIKALIPGCKIIIILRNPVDYLFSLYKHHRQTLRVEAPFSEMIKQEAYLGQALFSVKLKAYLDCFLRDQVYIGYYEEFKSDQINYLKNLYRFLDIEVYKHAQQNTVINVAVEAKYN